MAEPENRARRERGLSSLTAVGLILLLAGLGCLGYVVYQLFGTNVVSQNAYKQEIGQLRQQWQRPVDSAKKNESEQVTAAVPGDAIALLRIPRFGSAYQVPVLAGTDLDTLTKGVGHYDNTAMPGQVGNFAVAGHRITHGQPFSKLEELRQGDAVVVETRTAIYTYRLDTAPPDLTVKEDAGWVLDPVPGEPTEAPSRAIITLTTCQDLFHSPDRSVGFGTLVETEPKQSPR